ncbi:MAG: leucine-rich repeat protein [Eubacterium sp.]
MKKFLATLLAVVMLATTIMAVPFSAGAMTASDASSAKVANVTSGYYFDSNVSIDVEDGYVYYKVTVDETAVYSLHTDVVDESDTYGYLYSSTDLNSVLAEDDDSYGNSHFEIVYPLEQGKTYYLAIRYYDNDSIGTDFSVVIDKDTTTVAYDGVLYTKDSILVDGNPQDIYYASGYYFSQPTAVTIKGSINSLPVKYIDEDLFEHCKNITSVTIEDGIEHIYEKAFYCCNNLGSVILPNTLTEIDNLAFYGCSSLSSVRLPSALKIIGDRAFASTAIKSITIPASVETLAGTFDYAGMLETINVNSANSNYKSINGVLFSKDGKFLYKFPEGKIAVSYTIPEGVEIVYYDAFAFVSAEKIIFPSTVKTISADAFNGALCSEIVLNEGLESIGAYAFDNTRFSTINLPGTLTAIESHAFYWSNLVSVDIPASVKTIGDYAFYNNYLESAVFNSDSATISYNAFNKKTTLFGNTGSTAETFASSNGYKFVAFTTTPCAEHSYVIDEYIVEPTCKSKGKATTYCGACGQAGPETEVNKLNHDYYHGICTMCQTQQYVCNELKLNGTSSVTVTSDGEVNLIYKVAKDGKYTLSFDKASQLVDWRIFAIHSNSSCYMETYGYDEINGSLTINAKAGDVIMLFLESSYSVDENISFTASVKCEHATTATTTTRATMSSDGKIVKKCAVCAKTLSTTVIPKVSSAKLSATSYTYDGKVKTPTVTVKDRTGKKLVKNTDYTVSYASGRKNVGKYKVTVRFKGKYSGTKTLYFTIKPKATGISSISARSKGFTVKWYKRTTQTTGYQVQYSTSSKFTSPKTVTIGSTGTTSKTVSKLTAKKKYYVRVRTYKTVNGTRYYSSWSKAKYVTTKS